MSFVSKLHEAKHHVNVTLDMDEMDWQLRRGAKGQDFAQRGRSEAETGDL